jgi:hypothetical protein
MSTNSIIKYFCVNNQNFLEKLKSITFYDDISDIVNTVKENIVEK